MWQSSGPLLSFLSLLGIDEHAATTVKTVTPIYQASILIRAGEWVFNVEQQGLQRLKVEESRMIDLTTADIRWGHSSHMGLQNPVYLHSRAFTSMRLQTLQQGHSRLWP